MAAGYKKPDRRRGKYKTNGPPKTGRPLCFVYQALALFARFAMRLILRAAVFL